MRHEPHPQLQNELSNAFIRHRDLLIKEYTQTQILDSQIEILNAAIRTLSDALKVCNKINHLRPQLETFFMPPITWNVTSMRVHRKLWNEIFDALNKHHDLLRKPHEQQNILHNQIDTLYGFIPKLCSPNPM